MVTSTFFSESEFQRCNPPCSLQDMKQELMNVLDSIRMEIGIPLTITSAFRTVDYEHMKGRAGTSSHVLGLAADISITDSLTRFKVTQSAIKHGVTRIGIGNGFIHLDIDTNKPQNVMWVYY